MLYRTVAGQSSGVHHYLPVLCPASLSGVLNRNRAFLLGSHSQHGLLKCFYFCLGSHMRKEELACGLRPAASSHLCAVLCMYSSTVSEGSFGQ